MTSKKGLVKSCLVLAVVLGSVSLASVGASASEITKEPPFGTKLNFEVKNTDNTHFIVIEMGDVSEFEPAPVEESADLLLVDVFHIDLEKGEPFPWVEENARIIYITNKPLPENAWVLYRKY